jgi:CubicO group peptidase (beta-lactamase class C family)
MVILRSGEMVAERCGVQPETIWLPAEPSAPSTRLTSWSLAKSITHAAVGVLVGQGALDPNAPAAVPEWQGTEKQVITLLDLLEMRSGLRFVEERELVVVHLGKTDATVRYHLVRMLHELIEDVEPAP